MGTRTLPEPDLWAEPVAKAVIRLKELKINFLAVDFDQTLISIHTGGVWKGTAEQLAKQIRPMFQHFVSAAMASGIHVAVVTFSPQVQMVREVLEVVFGHDNACRIPIRGADPSWQYNGQGPKTGKQPHMASAAEELEHHHEGLDITRQSTLLIDDDGKNVRIALSEGVRGVWLNPNRPHRMVKDIIKLV